MVVVKAKKGRPTSTAYVEGKTRRSRGYGKVERVARIYLRNILQALPFPLSSDAFFNHFPFASSPAILREDAGQVVNSVSIIFYISVLRSINQEHVQQATTDPLLSRP